MGFLTTGDSETVLRADPVVWADQAMSLAPSITEEEQQQDETRQARAAERQQWAQVLVLAGYAAVVAVGIAWHEPWADEAQAWLLARDQGFWHLMLHAVRYEGSPGLWHAFLWALTRAHVSYFGMHWVAGAIAVAGVYVLLRWSPFPLILKILLPFGFWLAYQDAVVARSYVLYAILAFPAAAILRGMTRDQTPADRGKLIWLAVLLGLMANLSVHGFVASLGFAIVALVLLRRKTRGGLSVSKTYPAVLLCCFWLFAMATTFPPSDINFGSGKNVERSTEKIWATLGSAEAKKQFASQGTADVRPGELAPVAPIQYHRTPREIFQRKVAHVLSLFTFPVSNFRYLALACIVLVVVQAIAFGRSRGDMGWIGLAPWALLVVLFLFIYIAPRHAGMLWESLLAALWLTWPALPATGFRLWLQRITVAALIVVAADQVWWTAHALWADIHGPYSGDKAMARFIQSEGSGKQIAGFSYHSIGTSAFFDRRIYFNQPTSYWIWSRNMRVDQEAPQTIARHPDIIDVGGFDWSEHNGTVTDDWITPDPAEIRRIPLADVYGIIPYAEAHGYRETHRFCGQMFMRQGYSESECQVVLEPVPVPVVEPAAPAPVTTQPTPPAAQ
ncbi:MAG TPA: hypothetical protein VGF88_05055 [Acidobacteriaceae bacterium]